MRLDARMSATLISRTRTFLTTHCMHISIAGAKRGHEREQHLYSHGARADVMTCLVFGRHSAPLPGLRAIDIARMSRDGGKRERYILLARPAIAFIDSEYYFELQDDECNTTASCHAHTISPPRRQPTGDQPPRSHAARRCQLSRRLRRILTSLEHNKPAIPPPRATPLIRAQGRQFPLSASTG